MLGARLTLGTRRRTGHGFCRPGHGQIQNYVFVWTSRDWLFENRGRTGAEDKRRSLGKHENISIAAVNAKRGGFDGVESCCQRALDGPVPQDNSNKSK